MHGKREGCHTLLHDYFRVHAKTTSSAYCLLSPAPHVSPLYVVLSNASLCPLIGYDYEFCSVKSHHTDRKPAVALFQLGVSMHDDFMRPSQCCWFSSMTLAATHLMRELDAPPGSHSPCGRDGQMLDSIRQKHLLIKSV